jgi:hypothetical protein
VKISDPLEDAAAFEDVAARLRAIPWGQAPIDRLIERLAQEGKLKRAAVHSFMIFEVRRRILWAWGRARFMTANQRRRERSHTVAQSRAYRERLSGLRALVIQLRRWDRRFSQLDQLAALSESDTELFDDLRANLMGAQLGTRRVSRAARRVSKVLAAYAQGNVSCVLVLV